MIKHGCGLLQCSVTFAPPIRPKKANGKCIRNLVENVIDRAPNTKCGSIEYICVELKLKLIRFVLLHSFASSNEEHQSESE